MSDQRSPFRFRNWSVYKRARTFRSDYSHIARSFPKTEQYEPTNQTRRALNSIVLNIAEGANKTTDKDTRLYINRALCSLDEVVPCFDCALDDAYITAVDHKKVLSDAQELAKELSGFARHLSHS